MQITIRSKNINITKAMEEKIRSSFKKLEKYTQLIDVDAQATVEVHNYKEGICRVGLLIDAKGKNNIFKANETDKDFYWAVDKVKKNIEKQILKLKDKRINH